MKKKFTPKKILTEEQIEAKREYYRQYYQRKKREKGIVSNCTRGRKPKPKAEPYTIKNIDAPYIVTFD